MSIRKKIMESKQCMAKVVKLKCSTCSKKNRGVSGDKGVMK